MHLLSTSSTSLDDIVEPVDLGQTPGDIAILSFADSDLAGLSAAWAAERDALPSVRLVQLRDLKHPMSVDLWIERVASHAKVIVVRMLGGLDWWRYGADRLSSLAKERGIALAMLPGEDRDDPRLAECSTLPPDELSALLGYFREGGRDNLRALLRRLSRHAGSTLDFDAPQPLPRFGGTTPAGQAIDLDRLVAALPHGKPVVPVVFYRSMLLASDVAPIDGLCAALAARGLVPVPLFVTSLKDPESSAFLREAMRRLAPSVIVATTAFAAGDGATGSPLDDAGVPVLQAVVATTKRAAWLDSPRGLGAADLAMHVVLPELDGRVLAGAISFKDPSAAARRPVVHRHGQSARARPHRPDRRSRGGMGEAAKSPARSPPHRGADAGLSRRAGPDRLCGGSRRAGERARFAGRSRTRRICGGRGAEFIERVAARARNPRSRHGRGVVSPPSRRAPAADRRSDRGGVG